MEDMKEKIAIITDSCADIPQDWVEKYHIFVLPLIIRLSDGEYHDGVDIHPADIYERLKTELPKTSTPSGDDIEKVFEAVRSEGYHKAIAIMLSGGLSGTVNHVRLAAEEMDDLQVEVIDSRSGSIGIGATAIMAAEYVMAGHSFEETVKYATKLIDQTYIFFSVDTLEYLEKGGRIGKAAALLGGLLNIKPILTVDVEEGLIVPVLKVRGHKAIIKHLMQLVKDKYEEGRPYNLMIADGASPEERDVIEARITELFPDYHHLIKVNIGATLSSYIGPGVLGAAIQYIDD